MPNFLDSVFIEGGKTKLQAFDIVQSAPAIAPLLSNIEVKICNSGAYHNEKMYGEDNDLIPHIIGERRVATPMKGGSTVQFGTDKFIKDAVLNKEIYDRVVRLSARAKAAKASGMLLSRQEEAQLAEGQAEIIRLERERVEYLIEEIERSIIFGKDQTRYIGLSTWLSDITKPNVVRADATMAAGSNAGNVHSIYLADMTDGISLLQPADADGILSIGKWRFVDRFVDVAGGNVAYEEVYWKKINAELGLRVKPMTGTNKFGAARLANIQLKANIGAATSTGTIYDRDVRAQFEGLARRISLSRSGPNPVVHAFVGNALYGEMNDFYRNPVNIPVGPAGPAGPAYRPRIVEDIANEREKITPNAFGIDPHFFVTERLVVHYTAALDVAESAI